MASAKKASARESAHGRLVPDKSAVELAKHLSPGSRVQAMKWVPDRRKNKELLAPWELPVLIVENASGLRHIMPRGGLKDFLVEASVGGRGILFQKEKPSGEIRQTYRLMHLLFQQGFNDRRMMGRRFRNLEELSLKRHERPGDSARTILPPDDLPQPPELYRIGRNAAEASGIKKLDMASTIELGLLEVAETRLAAGPPIAERKASGALRMVLFGQDAGDLPDSETISLIEERLWEAVWKHRECSLGQFKRFFWKDVGNLVDQFAKRKPKVRPDEVRQVLDSLLWRSYSYVSQCISLQMQEIADAMKPPLSAEEWRLHNHHYGPQPELGGLAAVMLTSRLWFICRTWDRLASLDRDHEGQAWTALLLALSWHNEMVNNRRRADVLGKSQQERCVVSGRRSRCMVSPKREQKPRPLAD